MNARATRFPLFDSLRAIAALAVFGTHAYGNLYHYQATFARPYAARLDVGVHIFFAISGFLLYRPFVRARLRDTPSPRVAAYAWRRTLRLGPAYWVALTAVVLWLSLPSVLTIRAPLFYGFAQIYSPRYAISGLPQAWSLCVEASFYLFLPLYALAIGRLAVRIRGSAAAGELAAAAGLFVGALAFNGLALALGTPNHYGRLPLHLMFPAYMNDFAVGMALAILSVHLEGRELPGWLRPIDRFPSLAWAVALLAFWAMSSQIGIDAGPGEHISAGQYLARAFLYSVVAVALIAPAVFGDQRRGVVRRLLANRVLLFVGLVSYSFFLYHVAVIVQLQRWHLTGSAPIWFGAGLGLSLAIAAASYYVVERPALKLKSLVGRQPEPLATEAIAEPAPVAPARAGGLG